MKVRMASRPGVPSPWMRWISRMASIGWEKPGVSMKRTHSLPPKTTRWVWQRVVSPGVGETRMSSLSSISSRVASTADLPMLTRPMTANAGMSFWTHSLIGTTCTGFAGAMQCRAAWSSHRPMADGRRGHRATISGRGRSGWPPCRKRGRFLPRNGFSAPMTASGDGSADADRRRGRRLGRPLPENRR